MPKTLYYNVVFVAKHDGAPSGYRPYPDTVYLYIGTIKTNSSKYVQHGGYNDISIRDYYDYAEFRINFATFTRPPDFYGSLKTYEVDGPNGSTETSNYFMWRSISVPDDYVIPTNLYGSGLLGDFGFSESDRTSIEIGPLAVDLAQGLLGGQTVASLANLAAGSVPALLEVAFEQAGFSGIAAAINNAQVVKNLIHDIQSQGMELILAGIESISDPSSDGSEVLEAIDGYFASLEGRFDSAFDDIVMIPGNDLADDAAHDLVRGLGLIGNFDSPGQTPVELEKLEVTGSWNSTLNSSASADFGFVLGGEGNFAIEGLSKRNVLIGGGGSNVIHGGTGNDILMGGGGDDDLSGGSGSDVIRGGPGRDSLSGSTGNDLFLDTLEGLNGDTIEDFSVGDRLTITDIAMIDLDFSFSGSSIKVNEREIFLPGIPAGSSMTISGGGDGGTSFQLVGPPLPLPQASRLFAQSGLSFAVGGNVKIFGTSGFQEAIVLDVESTLEFDPSFARGGDVIRLPYAAAEATAELFGVSVRISDGDTAVIVPVGSPGCLLSFSDGLRRLYYDEGGQYVKIGSQTVTNTSSVIVASSENVFISQNYNSDAVGKLFFSTQAEVSVGGDLSIFGTSQRERVWLIYGDIELDPSFARGGDVVELTSNASAFSARRVEASVELVNASGSVKLPVGETGAQLKFEFEDLRLLSYDPVSEEVRIGNQIIGFENSNLFPFG